jgi:hypothetical protein
MLNNHIHHVQRSTEYDRTPTLVATNEGLITVPAWVATILDRVNRKEGKR